MRPILVLFLIPFLLAASMTVVKAESDYLHALQQQAEARHLSHHRGWRDLLHYSDRRLLPGQKSATRASSFFNAENGHRDPSAELKATLAAFFRDPTEVAAGEQHPQCAFIARYHWLKEHLDFDPDRLKPQACPRFRQWYEAIAPHAVTLIFADAYMNSPASMFGHTLLRVDSAGQGNDERLLSYAINHAAATAETSGLVFAVRGLTGGYPGFFSIMPYYEKVNEYNSLENRDLWELELNLNQEEVDRLLMHVWEVGSTPFPYYFLYQNCSYRLLQLLDVARPGMNLTDEFDWWAIPTDTVRVVLEQEDLLRDVQYRPSSRSRLEYALSRLSPDEQEQVRQLSSGELDPEDSRLEGLVPERLGLMLESAHDYLHYRFQSGEAEPEARQRMRSLLIARSRTAVATGGSEPPRPAVRPDQGHATHRLGIGGGERDGAGFASLHWRPAYHDLLDPPAGYRLGSHISFLDTRLHYDLERESLELDRLMLVDIESMAPRDGFFRSWSWHIGAGLSQRLRPEGGYSLMAGAEGGGGPSWALDQDGRFLMYTAAHGSVWGSERLEDNVRAGIGPRLDLLYMGERWRGRVRAEAQQYSDDGERWRLAAEQDLSLGKRLGLRLSVSRESDFDQQSDRVDLSLHWYR